MRLRNILLAALSFALVLGLTAVPAWAYFTDQSTTNGGLPITVGPDTEIYEWVKGNEKHIVITNDNDAAPAFVRVKVNSSASVTFSDPDKMWEKQGDWYVYKEAVPAGGQTTELVVKIDFDSITTVNDRPPVEDDTVNVVVIYESVVAKYKADGSPDYGGWVDILDRGVQNGGE